MKNNENAQHRVINKHNNISGNIFVKEYNWDGLKPIIKHSIIANQWLKPKKLNRKKHRVKINAWFNSWNKKIFLVQSSLPKIDEIFKNNGYTGVR